MENKALGLIGFLLTLMAIVFVSSCNKDKNLKKGNQIDFRDSIIGMYACTTRSHHYGSYPDSTGTFVSVSKITIDSIHLDTFKVTKEFLANAISMDGKTFTADSGSHEVFNTQPFAPTVYNRNIQFSIKDKSINYSYVGSFTKFTRTDEYRYGRFIGN